MLPIDKEISEEIIRGLQAKAEKFAKEIIGLTLDEADAICNFEKIKIRVVSTDGKNIW